MHQSAFFDSEHAYCDHLFLVEHSLLLQEGVLFNVLIHCFKLVLEDLIVQISKQLLPLGVL